MKCVNVACHSLRRGVWCLDTADVTSDHHMILRQWSNACCTLIEVLEMSVASVWGRGVECEIRLMCSSLSVRCSTTFSSFCVTTWVIITALRGSQ